MYYKKNVDHVELLWEDFIYQIDNKAYKKQEKMYYPRFTKVIIHYFLTKDKTISWRNKIGMHTFRDDYLINTLRFISANEVSQIYGARLQSKFRGVIGDTLGVSVSKKNAPTKGDRGKGMELLSEVALTKEAQFEEVRRKSTSDFHMTHPSAAGAAKIKPSVTNKGTGSDSEQETDDNETSSESDKQENEEEVKDDDEEEEEFVKTSSNYAPWMMKMKPRKNQRLMISLKEGTDIEMISIHQGNENLEITLDQVIEDAHVTISTFAKKTEVLATSSSHSSDLAAKFLNFTDVPHTDAEIVSPMDVLVHHEVPSGQTPTLLTPQTFHIHYNPSLLHHHYQHPHHH
uniref:Uncharacterized protein n=1 Tax=Tanacetum cinerariifolium TaxID=118510 RepID=A0A699JCU1_TANCI|nr:hypothetical protein [Tanacetum cinerariifolium]